MMNSCFLVLLFDMILGEPPDKFHPTVWIGKLVAFLEKIFYLPRGIKSKLAGVLLVIITVSVCATTGILLESAIMKYVPAPYSFFITAAIASLTIACRSLASHAMPVLKALCAFNIVDARQKLSMIVGRDTRNLNRSEISRACVETIAEGLGDGIVSPLFFFVFFGLGGAFAYRAVNTMDSMIGHKDDRYVDFGWAAARLDDVLNFIPARLFSFASIAITALIYGRFCDSFKTAFQYHGSHKSPNSGWLESAAAGALGIRLGGTNYYNGEKSDYPFINKDARLPRAGDIKKCILLITGASFISAIMLDIALSFIMYYIN